MEIDVLLQIPPCPKNKGEDDLGIGSRRMQRLIPYACKRLGVPPPPNFGEFSTPSGTLSFRDDIPMLCAELRVGKEKLRQFYSHILSSGIENVRASDFLKRAPGGGKGTSKLREGVREILDDVIQEVCVRRGYFPGSKPALKAVRRIMCEKGVSPLPDRRTLKAALENQAVIKAHHDSVSRYDLRPE